MNWFLLNLPFMILATALILGIMAVGLYLDYRKEEAKQASMARHPSVVSKAETARQASMARHPSVVSKVEAAKHEKIG